MSGLCLGTVQLGMKYGIKNELGRQPTEAESFAVLRAAQNKGIRCLDTASVYGEAETLLGRFGAEQAGFQVVSKLRPGLEQAVDGNHVLHEIEMSLHRMHMHQLHGYMLHNAEDMNNEAIIRGMQAAKEKGYVRHIGVSVYEPEEAIRVVRTGIWDMVQIPYNVFDQRLDASDFFELAKKNHVMVFARSAFLQGLLLMEPSKLPTALSHVLPYLERFRAIIERHGYMPEEGAMLYSYCHTGIDYVVFGVDTEAQLVKNTEICDKAEGFAACWNNLRGAFTDVPREIIIPSLWKNN